MRNTIIGITVKSSPIILEECVCIRPITEEELWGLGDESWPTKFNPFFVEPSEEWNILDIELKHEPGTYVSELANSLRGAVVIGLLLLSPANFGIEQITEETNYGIRMHGRWSENLQLNRGGSKYVLDNRMSQRLKSLWPRLHKIIEAKDNYLRLPVARLVDGATRSRPEDAILDYSIGLESLLTRGVSDELSYRFALRGATILAWESSNKDSYYKSLRDFYDIRSKIVHGSQVDEEKLRNAQSKGEEALRKIWWWFFDQDQLTPEQALLEVDNRILE